LRVRSSTRDSGHKTVDSTPLITNLRLACQCKTRTAVTERLKVHQDRGFLSLIAAIDTVVEKTRAKSRGCRARVGTSHSRKGRSDWRRIIELHGQDHRVSITCRSITVRITSKGQVTIPIEVREKLGLLPNTEVAFKVHGNTARIVKVSGKRAGGRGANVLVGLRGRADVRMTTDEILALTRKAK
jgi:AbrB family looped-hinge helix DNA binding protein